jgi:hypothetical protein
MAGITRLTLLRHALLLRPDDPDRWQELIGLITELGGALHLADIDGLFVRPPSGQAIAMDEGGPASLIKEIIEQALAAHRSGNATDLNEGIKKLDVHNPANPWLHGLGGLHAEMDGRDGYAEFSRALEQEPSNAWFRYWKCVAALRRRDWIDFSFEALYLHESETIEHQSLVFAAIYHLIAAAIVELEPESCVANDLRVFDLIHPDRIHHTTAELEAGILRFINKERRKMLRILLDRVNDLNTAQADQLGVVHQLNELLRWRVIGLAEPQLSAGLVGALLTRLNALPPRRHEAVKLSSLLPQRPGLNFEDDRVRIWSDFRLDLSGRS